jgi:hypothetical protein
MPCCTALVWCKLRLTPQLSTITAAFPKSYPTQSLRGLFVHLWLFVFEAEAPIPKFNGSATPPVAALSY